jgi:ABC-type branched-subunit amino acid transport system substrate-binding protein
MRRGLLGVAVVLALAAVACSNAKAGAPTTTVGPGGGQGNGKFQAVNQPGVTADTINVGGVASITNPLGGTYGNAFLGAQAYFDMVNSEGGIYGRKLKLTEQRDDQLVNNKAEVDALISDPNIFAILPVAVLTFSGADDAVKAGIPTFGWTINPEWSGTPDNPKSNLFGQSGSYLGFTDPNYPLVWLASEMHAKNIGVLAYSVPQSADCATGVKNGFDKYGKSVGAKIAFIDQSLQFGVTDLSVQVSKMKQAGVDLITTCMDQNGVVTLAKEMKKQKLNAKQYLPNGYDEDFVKQFGDLFQGTVVRTDFTQWQLPDSEQPAGLKNFLTWMKKSGNGDKLTENSMAGWLNADLFVNGLKAAGQNFTRQSLIAAINKMTDYNAGGILYGVNWTKQHTQDANPTLACEFKSTIKNDSFDPNFSKPAKPWHCTHADPATGTVTADNQA